MKRTIVFAFAAFLASTRADAGPVEARARWRDALAMKRDSPWRLRVLAYRAVRVEAAATDPIQNRAFAAEAKILREAGHAEGAAAAEGATASLGPRHDEDRIHAALAAARSLLADGDTTGARVLLDDVVGNGGSATPTATGPALVLLARLAFDAGDGAGLFRLDRRAADDVPSAVATRLQILDLVGLHRLDAGDAAGAKRAFGEQSRLFDQARRSGGAPEREAAKAWLDLELPRRLDGR